MLVRKIVVVLLLLLVGYRQQGQVSRPSSPRLWWDDSFLDGYFQNVILSQLFVSVDSAFILLFCQAYYRHSETGQSHTVTKRALRSSSRLRKVIHAILD